ncbi:MAG: DUF2782 domain-containing protein [Pseudomonadota bacterium]
MSRTLYVLNFLRTTFVPVALGIGACCASLTLAVSSQAEESLTDGPDVVIISGEDKVVYEFRQNGQLRMVRVVPKWGKPYYLVPADPTKGYGDLERAETLIPQWVIAEF